MQSITVTLNGREVQGRPGMTILELAEQEGVRIPRLCYERHLTAPGAACPSVGACRICIVENEQTGALMTACTTFITPGMAVSTHSPRVIERRRTIIELMLASHPDACLVCDKGNRCQLRQIAAELGVGLIGLQRIPQTAFLKDANPFIKRDLSKCILCAKCIRACQELVVEGAIDYFRRGFVAKPATFGEGPLEASECTFCGTCVALCPTGALVEAELDYRGSVAATVRTTCPYCGGGCSLYLEVKDGRIVRAVPDRSDPVTKGTLCVRGSFGYDFVHSPERLTRPLVNVNGSFEPVSWEKAIAVVAAAFKSIKERYGSDSLAVYGSARCTNEENYLLQRFARTVLGTNNIDNGSRLYGGAPEAYGLGAPSRVLRRLEEADLILVVGADPTTSVPLTGYAVKRAVRCREAKLIVVDPRETRLVFFAECWLRPRPGTDAALLSGLAKVLIEEGLVDWEAVEKTGPGFAAFKDSLAALDLRRVEEVTGVSVPVIRQAAELYAKAQHPVILYGNGLNQQARGTEAVRALINLAQLAGGRAAICALQRDANARGACDMGTLPDFLPGFLPVADQQVRRSFRDYWGRLPATPGRTVVEMLQGAREGQIKGMYIVGENLLGGFPDAAFVREALGSLDFLVVQDLFLTETARLAKVVLPAAAFAEKEGTFTSFDGRVNWLRQAVAPPGESLPDWEIILRLAAAMDCPLPYEGLRGVREEIARLVPAYRGLGFAEAEAVSEVAATGESAAVPVYRKQLEVTPHFWPIQELQPPDSDPVYPFTLLVGSTLFHFGTGARSARARRLGKFYREAAVFIRETDAARLGLHGGEKVRLIAAAGEVTVTAKISATLPEGVLFAPFSPVQDTVGRLFTLELDPERKTPLTKMVKVRVERIGSDE